MRKFFFYFKLLKRYSLMKKRVLINNEPSEILGWFSVYGHSALVLSKSDISENYFIFFPKFKTFWSRTSYLL